MGYESLKTLFYKDTSNDRYAHADSLLKLRLEAESTFRTGVVTPSGELFLAVPRELSLLNERIHRHERLVAAGMRALPPVAQWALIRGLVIDEVVSTNELEGVYSTRRQVNELLRPETQFDDPQQQKRFRELAKLYMGLSEGVQQRPTKPDDIRAIYDKVMDGEPLGKGDRPDGRLFRKGRVDIIGPGSRVIHEGLYPEARIIEAIEKMLAIANADDVPETFGAVIAHFIFEYAHPFYDGNGRTGRYLLALCLSSPLSLLTTLSLSRVIAENRDAYYRSFKDAEHPLNHGELTFFVMNMLENVSQAQTELDLKLSEKRVRLDDVEHGMQSYAQTHGLDDKERDIVYMLAQLDLFATFPEASQDEIAEYIGLGKQQSRVYTKRLQETGIISAVSKRPLRFVLSDRAAGELATR